MAGLPAILGGNPVFKQMIPISSATLPEYSQVVDRYQDVFASGMITNWKYVSQYEERMARYLGVNRRWRWIPQPRGRCSWCSLQFFS